MRRFRAPSSILLLLILLWPALAGGQPVPSVRAGVVTALRGAVTATRQPLPQPVPLKFKDDVYLQDRIATGDRALARLLLGGKAVVTVRERSVLTIKEVPGRSAVTLDTGKIGLSVAREKMQPDEVLDIRTPNAIVAVRGTVLVVEVQRATAAAEPGPTSPVTIISVLRDSTGRGVVVTLIDPATGAIIGGPFVLLAFQQFTVAGGAPGTTKPFTPADVDDLVLDLQGPLLHHDFAGNEDDLAFLHRQIALGLIGALFRDPEQLERFGRERRPEGPLFDADERIILPPILPGNANLGRLIDTGRLSLREHNPPPPPPPPPPPQGDSPHSTRRLRP